MPLTDPYDRALARFLYDTFAVNRVRKTYGDTSRELEKITGIKRDPHTALPHNLGRITTFCAKELDLPMLSIATYGADGDVGIGFYKIACTLKPEYKNMTPTDVKRIELARCEAARENGEWQRLADYLNDVPINVIMGELHNTGAVEKSSEESHKVDNDSDIANDDDERRAYKSIEEIEFELINTLYENSQNPIINSSFTNVPEYSDLPEDLPEKIDTTYGKVYKIDPAKSRRAIIDAGYSCAVSKEHESFIRKDGKNLYTEAHHLIPRSYQDNFQFSLDVPANIVSLCSNCHNWLHYGIGFEDILETLYNERKIRLENVGLKISFEQLKSFY